LKPTSSTTKTHLCQWTFDFSKPMAFVTTCPLWSVVSWLAATYHVFNCHSDIRNYLLLSIYCNFISKTWTFNIYGNYKKAISI